MESLDGFDFMVVTPAGTPDPRLAIAASRAGAIGILNLEFCRDEAEAAESLRALRSHGRDRIGIQLSAHAVDALAILQDAHQSVPYVLLSHIDSATLLPEFVSRVHSMNAKAVIVTTSLEQARHAESSGADAVVARGHESGGRVGDETSFVLLQRLIDQVTIPVWIQGGVGEHSVSATAVGGAAGAVLDSQLLLTKESPLSSELRSRISSMDGSETLCLGTSIGAGFRAYVRPGLEGIGALRRIETKVLVDNSPADASLSNWQEAVNTRVGWKDLSREVLAVGQDACFADTLARRYGTVGGVIEGLRRAVKSNVAEAKRVRSFAPGSPLAASHGTRFPIVQGPMTRVSDRAAFAESVAGAGALPFVALALMRGPDAQDLLEETAKRLGEQPWGVGILGFVPPELRAEQLAVIHSVKPPFALIAGGRPDQARSLEDDGITTYLHVPSPGLLRMYLQDGATRFVFEGRECGGHVGPRTSFVLWDTMVDVLLNELPKNIDPSTIHVLFAGGIHDGRSAAMVSALAAPLAARGIRVGGLIGSAYLFTHEAVASGAITDIFQQAAIDCERTVLLESGPGHATRCAPSPFVGDFEQAKRQLLQESLTSDEVRNRLEELNIGRLRIASKGVDRNPDYGSNPAATKLVPVERMDQWERGMYMIGQVAALRSNTCSMAQLHTQICDGAVSVVDEMGSSGHSADEETVTPCDIAIVGIGCILPGAPDLSTFWANVLNKVDAITEVPPSRWDWRQYYDPDRNARDKIYSKWGGFIDDVPFDPVSFGMPPSSLNSIEPFQLLALLVVRAALEDAGMVNRPFARERTSVVLGAGGGGGDLSGNYVVRSNLPSLFGESAQQLTDDLGDALPEWTEDSFAGILMNVAAGRIANRFDFGGLNYTVDAACASSLAAIYLAVRDLESGHSDVAIAGGVDAIQNPFAFLCFAKTQALSPTGHCRPFDAEADGIAISEGFATVVLKRLADAERDGDRIYAVIRGVGGASDGRDRSLTAPRPEGQMRALERAYAQAGYSPTSVGLIEAHGTGTVAGDRAEVEALSRFFSEFGAERQSTAIGSVKSMIGHTKAAAGVAGLIKVALSLHHGVLPPTLGVTQPNPKAGFGEIPLYVNSESRPWTRHPNGDPRRAGVSAFGFGGTDFHITLEEYGDEYLQEPRVAVADWPSELFIWKAESRTQLRDQVRSVVDQFDSGALPRMSDLAYTLALSASRITDPDVTLAIVADSIADLTMKLHGIDELLDGKLERVHLPSGVHYSERPLTRDGGIAFLFPGQGSQYVDMARDLAVMFPEVRECFEMADSQLHENLTQPLSRYVFPPPAFTPEERSARQARLTETNVAQPALGTVSLAMLGQLRKLGIEPEMAAGHSYGEFVALHSAGCFDVGTLLMLSEARGRFMREGAGDDAGTMAAVLAGADDLRELAQESGVILANINAPRQTVISGTAEAVDRAITWCTERGIRARRLPVACAFHSPLVAPAQQRFSELLSQTSISAPRFPVFSNTTGVAHSSDPATIASTMCEHLTGPVRWLDEINQMYEAGARLFVEVGPRSVLSGLVGQILDDRLHVRVTLDQPNRNGVSQFLDGLATLASEGANVRVDRLFEGRSVQAIDLEHLIRASSGPDISSTTWFVNGGRAIPASQRETHRPHQPIAVRKLSQQDASDVSPLSTAQSHSRSQWHVPSEAASGPKSTHKSEAGEVSVPASFLTRNGGERAMASTPDSSLEPSIEVDDAMVRGPNPPPPSGASDDVMVMFQQVMQRFLDTQRSVMLAYLGGSAASEPRKVAPRRLPARRLAHIEQPVQSNGRAPGLDQPETAPDRATRQTMADAGIANGHEPEVATNGHEPDISEHQQDRPEPSRESSDAPATQTAVASASPSEPLSRDALLQLLLKVVSDRTGYPPDMLALDVDLEADLGIDSIKRVEISGTIIQELKLSPDVKPDLDRLTSSRTLNQVVDTLLDMIPAAPTVAATEEGTRPFESAPAGERIGRFLLSSVDAPMNGSAASLARDGVVVIMDDQTGVGDQLAQALASRGQRAVRIVKEMPPSGAEDVIVADIEQVTELRRSIDDLHDRFGRANAIVHLAALSPNPEPDQFHTETSHARRRQVLNSLLTLCQGLREDLETAAGSGGSAILTATELGGVFGSVGSPSGIRVTDGAVTGFAKTLAQEWTSIRVRSIDFTEEQVADRVEALVSELYSGDDTVEVAYAGGRRLRLSLDSSDLKDNGIDPLTRDSVVLITGGARGITAEVAHHLAVRYQPTLILVGRTPVPAEDPVYALGLTDRAELRGAVLEYLRARSATPSVAEVEREVSRIIGQREVRDALDRIRATGATAAYFSCDVRNDDEFSDLIDQIYREFGRIDGVIHGAGIIEDRLIRDKTLESFERVISTKVDGALTLARKLKADHLKFLVFFGSVSGRFGNRGQSDYAAANEIHNKLARQLDNDWPAHVVSINWGPWLKTGMVSPEVQRQFTERGVTLIPIDVGCQMLDQEIRSGQKGDVEVVVGGTSDPEAMSRSSRPKQEHIDSQSSKPNMPLLHHNTIRLPASGNRVVFGHTFDIANDCYLDHHRLDGRPVLPFAFAAELMAEAAAVAVPEAEVQEVRGIRLLNGLTFDQDQREIRISVDRPESEAVGSSGAFDAQVTVSSAGNPGRLHYRSTVILSPTSSNVTAAPPLMPLASPNPFPKSVEDAYRDWLFHGPIFQRILSIDRVSESGASAWLKPSTPSEALNPAVSSTWLIDPILVDGAFQMQVIWARLHWDVTLLPAEVGAISRFRHHEHQREAVRYELRIRAESSAPLCHADHYFFDASGKLIGQLHDVVGAGSRELNRLAGPAK